MIEKAYVRYRESMPDNANTYAAAEGLSMTGVKIVPFYGFGDINAENMPDIGVKAMLCGNIGDVWEALKIMGLPRPKEIDYPKHLQKHMYRTVKHTTLGEVTRGVRTCFVKPVQQKLFTGLVWSPDDPIARLNVAIYPLDTPVLVTNVLDFVSEYRCFVRDDELVGVKHYKGDWSKPLNREVVEDAVHHGRRKGMPWAYAIDMGVLSTGETALVEVNEGYALGSYGLTSIVYARMLETRWEQFVYDKFNPPTS